MERKLFVQEESALGINQKQDQLLKSEGNAKVLRTGLIRCFTVGISFTLSKVIVFHSRKTVLCCTWKEQSANGHSKEMLAGKVRFLLYRKVQSTHCDAS